MNENGREDRKTIRDKVFANRHESVVLDVFDTQLELRAPTLGAIMAAQDLNDTAKSAAQMIIDFCYVPGTEDLVFESTDMDILLNLRFGKDLIKLNTAIAGLTGVDIDAAKEELKSPLEEIA